MTQIIHITPEQYDFILRVFDDKTFGGTDDLRQKNGDPVDFEVIGCGLMLRSKSGMRSIKAITERSIHLPTPIC